MKIKSAFLIQACFLLIVLTITFKTSHFSAVAEVSADYSETNTVIIDAGHGGLTNTTH